MDLFSILFGITLCTLAYLLYTYSRTSTPTITIDDPTDDADYQKLHNTPNCPYCNSYNIILVDDNAGVSFLKGHIDELDHFQCQHCHETFSDEDWQNVKVYNN